MPTINAGTARARHAIALAAGVETRVAFDKPPTGRVQVVNYSETARVYWTADGSPAVVEGGDSLVVPAYAVGETNRKRGRITTAVEVGLISAATAEVAVVWV